MSEQMRIELDGEGYGIDVLQFVGINDKTAMNDQQQLIDECTFPLLQDTPEVDAWAQQGGGKDDIFVYDAAGYLFAYLPIGGDVNINLSTPEGYDAVKAVIVDALSQP